MKIRVFSSHNDTYNSIVIDVDELPKLQNSFYPDALPTVFISDLIEDLISEN